MSVKIPCRYGFDHDFHEFPDDWIFGGANNADPRADPRWEPTTYLYYDWQAMIIWTTQTPLCDDQAIDEFTKIRDMGPSFRPKWLGKYIGLRRDVQMLPVVYDPATDTVTAREQENQSV